MSPTVDDDKSCTDGAHKWYFGPLDSTDLEDDVPRARPVMKPVVVSIHQHCRDQAFLFQMRHWPCARWQCHLHPNAEFLGDFQTALLSQRSPLLRTFLNDTSSWICVWLSRIYHCVMIAVTITRTRPGNSLVIKYRVMSVVSSFGTPWNVCEWIANPIEQFAPVDREFLCCVSNNNLGFWRVISANLSVLLLALLRSQYWTWWFLRGYVQSLHFLFIIFLADGSINSKLPDSLDVVTSIFLRLRVPYVLCLALLFLPPFLFLVRFLILFPVLMMVWTSVV